MNIALTGASGMLGRHILEACIKKNFSMLCSSRTKPEIANNHVHWLTFDLGDSNLVDILDSHFTDMQYFIHAGAQTSLNDSNEKDMFKVNVESTQIITDFCLKNNITLIFISGAIVYDDEKKIEIKEEDPLNKTGFGGYYRETKYLAEEIINQYQNKGLQSIILRPSSIYGYGLAENKMILSFLRKASNGETIELMPPVDNKINFIHAADVATGIIKAIDSKTTGVYNIGYECEYSIKEIAESCIDVANSGTLSIKEENCESRPTIRYQINSQKAYETFDFTPQINLTIGLRKILEKEYT